MSLVFSVAELSVTTQSSFSHKYGNVMQRSNERPAFAPNNRWSLVRLEHVTDTSTNVLIRTQGVCDSGGTVRITPDANRSFLTQFFTAPEPQFIRSRAMRAQKVTSTLRPTPKYSVGPKRLAIFLNWFQLTVMRTAIS